MKQFNAARVPGAYLRVVAEGSIEAGDPISVSRPDHDVRNALAFRAYTTEPDLLQHMAAAGVLLDQGPGGCPRATAAWGSTSGARLMISRHDDKVY